MNKGLLGFKNQSIFWLDGVLYKTNRFSPIITDFAMEI